jgi:hypothetical protein
VIYQRDDRPLARARSALEKAIPTTTIPFLEERHLRGSSFCGHRYLGQQATTLSRAPWPVCPRLADVAARVRRPEGCHRCRRHPRSPAQPTSKLSAEHSRTPSRRHRHRRDQQSLAGRYTSHGAGLRNHEEDEQRASHLMVTEEHPERATPPTMRADETRSMPASPGPNKALFGRCIVSQTHKDRQT